MPNIKYYKVSEAAEIAQIANKTMYGLVREKKVPYVKIGGSIRIPIERFQNWLASRTVDPIE